MILLIACLITNGQGGSQSITGIVTTEGGEPLTGVTVNISNTLRQFSRTTTTNSQGRFKIDNVGAGESYTLVFSNIEYQTQTLENFIVKEGAGNSVLIRLAPSSTSMENVVVTALGFKRQERKLGYSVSELKSEDVSTNKTVNLQSALMGKVAGLDIGESANGIAGSRRTNLRGISTISPNGSNSPLWVIDGVPLNSGNFGRNNDAGGGIDYGDGLSAINPDDIATITVLKGNAAAALYGSRASNGVIIITTKNGKNGSKDFAVELKSSLNVSKIVDMTDWQYMYGQGRDALRPKTQQEALVTGVSSWGEKLDGRPTVQFDGQERPYMAQKNNVKNFYSDAVLFSNTLSVAKSAEKYNFRFSIGHTDSRDFVSSGKYRKRNAQVNASTTFGLFSVNLSSIYMNELVNNRQYIGGNVRNSNYTLTLIPTNVSVNPMKPGYLPDGKELIITDGAVTNPYFVIDRVYEEDSKHRLVNALAFRFEPMKGLFTQFKIMQDYYFFKRMNYQPEGMNWQPFGGEINQRWNEFHELNYELTAGYDFRFSPDLALNTIVGGNIRKPKVSNINLYGTPFVIPGIYTLNNTITKTTSTGYSESQVNSLFGMTELSYRNYLFLTLTGRNDWFSTLPIKTNNLFYPSASLSYVFTESLNLPTNVFSFGKLRASMAQVSGGADPYSLDLSYELDDRNYNGQVLQGIATTTIPNKNLKPLISTETEFGLELQMFKGLLSLDAAYYKKRIKDDIVAINVSNASGFNKAVMNTGNIDNSGIELMAEVRPINKKLKWASTFTFSKNYNKVLSLGGINSIQIGAAKNDPVTVNIDEGQPYGVIKGAVFKKDKLGNKIFDQDGYPIIGDRATILGRGYHDKIAGWNNRFSYGDISLNILFDGKFGGKLYSQTNRWAVTSGKHAMTLEGRENGLTGKGVKEDGSANDILVTPERMPSYFSRIAAIHEAFIYDASYIKLREFSLQYNLPKTIVRKTPFHNIGLGVTARNLLYLMNRLENVSPESNVSTSNVQGLENSGYPESRTYGVNLNITF